MKQRVLACLLLLALICGICQSGIALTSDGRSTLLFWVFAFDTIFSQLEEEVGEQIQMINMKSSFEWEEGVIGIGTDKRMVIMACDDQYRAYVIDDAWLFNYFAAKVVCEAVLSNGMLDEGVQVYFMNDSEAAQADADALQTYINAMDEI